MAEHRNVDPGPGPTFAPVAVDVDGSGDEWQRIKVGYGPDGTPADVTTANPLPVVQTGTPALPTGAATSALQTAEATLVGAVTESAPGTDTASSGLNGRLQRIAQRLTSLLAVLPAALGQTTKAGSLSVTLASNQDALPVTDNGGSLTVDGTVGISGTVPVSGTVTANAGTGPFPVSDNAGSLTVDAPVGTPAFVRLSDGSAAITTLPVSAASLPLPTGAALDATVGTTNTEIGGLTETAPATDTASSGLNGRLQRVAQRLTSLIALLPASLGQKTMANGLAVTIASDQSVIPVSDNSGSLTVDAPVATPVASRLSDGAAFLTTTGSRLAVDPSGVTSPVSAAALPLPSGAATEATLAAQTKVDNAAFTDGTTPVSPVGYVFDEVAGTALSENDVAAARIDAKRGQVSVIEDATTRGQRAAVSAAGALKVDGSAVTQPISGTIAVSGTMPVSVAAGQEADGHSANIGSLADASSASTLTGLLKNIKAALAAALTTELSTGLTTFSNTALSNTKTAVKASPGKVYGWMVHNPSAATAYIQVWNVAIGSITVGTTAPTYTIPLPAGASANVMSERGITHSTEINIAATTTPTGSTAPGTALVVSLFYV